MKLGSTAFPLYSTVECGACGQTFCWDVPRAIGGVCPRCGGVSLRKGRDAFEERMQAMAEASARTRAFDHLSGAFKRACGGAEISALYRKAKAASAAGELESRCLVCGRELTNPESIERLIGPDCWEDGHYELYGLSTL